MAAQTKADHPTPSPLGPLLEAMTDGAILLDDADRVLVWNTPYETLFPHLSGSLRPGMHVNEIVAVAVRTAKPGEDAAEPGWAARRLSAHAIPGQSFIQQVGGRTIESTARRTADGGLLVTHRDVTEQKRTLDALRESEKRVNMILTASSTAIWEFDIASGQTEIHGSVAHLFDTVPEPLSGKSGLLHFVHPQEQEIVADALKHSLIRGQPATIKCRLNRADGCDRWVQFAFEPKMDATGRASGSRGFVTDITDRVLTERKLVEQTVTLDAERQKFRDLLETTSDWYWEADADLRITSVSDNFARSTDISLDQIVGVTLPEFEKSDLHPQLSDEWRDDLVNRRDVKNMYVITNPDAQGRRFYLRIAGKPAYANDGTFAGYRGTASDITVGLARAQAFQQGQKLQALGTMAAGLAHEFNNILAIVLGYAASLRNELRADASAIKQIEEIIDAGNRGASLSRSLLSFGRSSRAVPREAVNARALITELPTLLKPLLGPGVDLAVKQGAAALWVSADRSILIQCLVNLVVNARDAMPAGGTVALALAQEPRNSDRIQRTGLSPDRDYLAISVSDSGVGMDRNTLNRLFEPFFTTKAVGKGTGLGLSLVFSFVKDHGGAVDVDSTPNVGTTFTLMLPVAPAATQSVSAVGAARRNGHSLAGLRALVVDDEPQLLGLYERMLRGLGVDVVAHADVNAALALLDDEQEHVDILVSDVLMPQMSGFRFAELAEALRPALKVLFVTGQPERPVEEKQMREGAIVLRKPFNADQLSTSLASLASLEAA